MPPSVNWITMSRLSSMCLSVQHWQWNVGGFLFPLALVSLLAGHRNAAWLGGKFVGGLHAGHQFFLPLYTPHSPRLPWQCVLFFDTIKKEFNHRLNAFQCAGNEVAQKEFTEGISARTAGVTW